MTHTTLRTLLTLAVLPAATLLARADDSPRQILNFDKNWKLHIGDAKDAQAPDFADASWKSIDVPYDYAIEGGGAGPVKDPAAVVGPFDKNSPAGAGGGYLDAGIAWFRKSFTLPASAKGQHVEITFDGVYMNSDVYLNGHLLGNHPYGYTSFHYDLTPYLNFSGPNTLAVRTDVQQPCSRWYSGAGIYRHVRLTLTNPVHIAPWGLYITTPEVSDSSATIKMQTTIANDSASPADIKLTQHLRDPQGNEVASVDVSGTVPPNATKDFTPQVHIKNPTRWSVDSPNLYTVTTDLSLNNQPVDEVSTHVGIRTIQFTKDNGFLLNGKRLQIQGTCNHHDLGALGSAINHRALQRQLQILKDMGCNALRTSHNPPDPELLDMADQMGFVVMDEAFDEWKHNKTKYGYGRFFDQWSEKDLTSMIHRDRNHPSIILWSIGNEIPEQGRPNGGEMARRLAGIVHREDPTRPVTAAVSDPFGALKNGYADALDVFGINYHPKDYPKFKGHTLFGSETASALSTRGEYDLAPQPDGSTKIEIQAHHQCTSYELDAPPWGSTAETSLLAIKQNPNFAGEFVWTGFDYIGEPTPYKWPSRSSYFGIVDLAGFPKDRFYLYQSQWTTKPVVHLLPHWNWPGMEGKKIPVWCFTNADSVELFLNGKSQGTRDWKNNKTLHLEWDVPYEPGTLKAVGKKDGKVIATDEVVTAGPAAKLELIPDRAKISADGDDLSFVTVKVEDKDGHLCPLDGSEISFSLSGDNASIAGLSNGDPTNLEPFKGTQHKAFHGLALAIIRAGQHPGSVTLTASTPQLPKTSTTITLSK